MSFVGNHLCTSFKRELLLGLHNFTVSTGDVFKIALYDNNASFTAATTDYTTSNEIAGVGYTAGGAEMTNVTPTASGTTALASFLDQVWSSATITARGALVYNSTAGTNAVMILDFGIDKSVANKDFVVDFPTVDVNNAIIKIA